MEETMRTYLTYLDPKYLVKFATLISYQWSRHNKVNFTNLDNYPFENLTLTKSVSATHPCGIHNNNCTEMCVPVPSNSMVYGIGSLHKDLDGRCMCGDDQGSKCRPSRQLETTKSSVPLPTIPCQKNVTVLARQCADYVLINSRVRIKIIHT